MRRHPKINKFESKEVERIWDQIEFYADMLLEILDKVSDENLWYSEFKGTNSIGNLALHLTGNLNHRIGVGIGRISYQRERDAEFSTKNIPKKKLVDMINEALSMTQNILKTVTNERLTGPHNIQPEFPEKDVGDLIVTVVVHFGYHVGQAATKMARLESGKLL